MLRCARQGMGVLDKFYFDMLQQDEMVRTQATQRPETAQEEKQRLGQAKEGLRKALADCVHGNFPVSANLLIQQSGFECDQSSDVFKQFCREMLKASLKVTEVLEMRAEGDYSYEEPAGLVYPTPAPQGPPSKLLSELIQLFLEDKESARKWEPKTREEYAACLNLLTTVIGDVPVGNITYEVMKDFRDKIRKLSANMNKKPRYRDKTVQEILEMDVDDPMSITNVNKYLVRASTCFNFAVKHDFMAKNPAEGLQIKQSKRVDELRERFTDDDLRRLFCSEEYIEDKQRHSYCFWLPVLALYHSTLAIFGLA
jgi:hypothetical protein